MGVLYSRQDFDVASSSTPTTKAYNLASAAGSCLYGVTVSTGVAQGPVDVWIQAGDRANFGVGINLAEGVVRGGATLAVQDPVIWTGRLPTDDVAQQPAIVVTARNLTGSTATMTVQWVQEIGAL